MGVSLGVLDLNGAEEDGGLQLESVVLHEFSFSGLLAEVEISLSAYDAKGKDTTYVPSHALSTYLSIDPRDTPYLHTLLHPFDTSYQCTLLTHLLNTPSHPSYLHPLTPPLTLPWAGKETFGTDAWLLAVVVTDPDGLTVQVGGNEWEDISRHFYSRYWPDTWMGRTSKVG